MAKLGGTSLYSWCSIYRGKQSSVRLARQYRLHDKTQFKKKIIDLGQKEE